MERATVDNVTDGAVTGGVRAMLRVEWLALSPWGLGGYVRLGEPWWLFVVLFLTPDLSFLGSLAGARAGAVIYNAAPHDDRPRSSSLPSA